MRLGFRSRVLVAMLVAALFTLAIALPVVATAFGGLQHGSACLEVPSTTLFCYDETGSGLIRLTYVAIAVAGAVTALVYWWLARWAARPLASVGDSVDRMGPTNLGQRLDVTGRRGDELKRLGDSIDGLMDRVAAGFEGQRRFAANASHELRTPLAVQRTLVEVTMEAPPEQRDLEVLARQLIATNERNVALVEGLLVLAESDRGLGGLQDVRLDRVTAEVVELHEEMAASHEVKLLLTAEPVTVVGDDVLLERLLTNLVQNAIRYNVAGGRVEVRTSATSPTLSVTNTGSPVPAEAIPRLFEPFRRLASDRTDRGGGAGLGLAIVRSIVIAHHGTVDAHPGPEGGLAVVVDLPHA